MVRILVAAIAVIVATVAVVAVFMSDAMLEREDSPAEVASGQSEGAAAPGAGVGDAALPEAPSLPAAEHAAGEAAAPAAAESARSETVVVTRVVRATPEGAQALGAAQSPAAPPPTVEEAAPAPAAAERAPAAAEESAEAAGAAQTAALPDEPAPAAAAIVPSFDVVRVEANGEAVIAGRAAPFATVILLNGDVEIARVVADASGAWVIVLAEPLAPGDHQLGLRAEGPDGLAVLSDTLVVVSVPLPSTAVAGVAPEGAESTAAEAGASGARAASPEAVALAEEAAVEREAVAPLAVLTARDELGASRILQQPEGAGLRDRALVLRAVDYDAEGYIVVSGRAEPGARVIVYLDGEPLGYARADAEGVWTVRPARPVSPGLHDLRVDQVDADGTVLARVATGFSRAELAGGFPKDHFVIVQPGNSLWRIARRTYGAGIRYSVIYQANEEQIQDPHMIFPGQIFVVPNVN